VEPGRELIDAVIRVGAGRGFIIEAAGQRLVVTAGHCLPSFPPCHGASYTDERTYPKLLGTLDDPKPTVWAECLYVDPIADIAILGTPDEQELYDEAEAYEEMTSAPPAMRISPITARSDAWVLTLDGRWVGCTAEPPPWGASGALWVTEGEDLIQSGMSGSPILDHESHAIGAVCCSNTAGNPTGVGNPNPRLTHALPGWL
jgi:hypothetical protein